MLGVSYSRNRCSRRHDRFEGQLTSPPGGQIVVERVKEYKDMEQVANYNNARVQSFNLSFPQNR